MQLLSNSIIATAYTGPYSFRAIAYGSNSAYCSMLALRSVDYCWLLKPLGHEAARNDYLYRADLN